MPPLLPVAALLPGAPSMSGEAWPARPEVAAPVPLSPHEGTGLRAGATCGPRSALPCDAALTVRARWKVAGDPGARLPVAVANAGISRPFGRLCACRPSFLASVMSYPDDDAGQVHVEQRRIRAMNDYPDGSDFRTDHC